MAPASGTDALGAVDRPAPSRRLLTFRCRKFRDTHSHPFTKEHRMRSYPRNSPEAAARIVALVLIADGHVCRSEFDVFEQLDGPRELGLPPDSLPRIVQTL